MKGRNAIKKLRKERRERLKLVDKQRSDRRLGLAVALLCLLGYMACVCAFFVALARFRNTITDVSCGLFFCGDFLLPAFGVAAFLFCWYNRRNPINGLSLLKKQWRYMKRGIALLLLSVVAVSPVVLFLFLGGNYFFSDKQTYTQEWMIVGKKTSRGRGKGTYYYLMLQSDAKIFDLSVDVDSFSEYQVGEVCTLTLCKGGFGWFYVVDYD